ncbi:unnamed protein product [Caenorhabditis auriculariae]|uniref:EGF-like domain-containing protein n=1 Tax=Caenorhabditis auriculariae TaxID=2777116 RepID=A0A8S1HLU9_9PELO|nr:unnamed protein product [Caenorhabditis auriculariae]
MKNAKFRSGQETNARRQSRQRLTVAGRQTTSSPETSAAIRAAAPVLSIRQINPPQQMEHFLALCCFGGQPFADFHIQDTPIDPTDWSAELLQVPPSNSSVWLNVSMPLAVEPLLEFCQLFNITFTSVADQSLYDDYKAEFSCRCPAGRSGTHCEVAPPSALALVSKQESQDRIKHFFAVMIIVVAAVLLALFCAFCMMVRGCFCDCFGPFRHDPDVYDKPLDPEDARHCLRKLREHRAREEMRNQPLVAPQESFAAPYPPTAPILPATAPLQRPPSPPPAYSQIDPSTLRSSNI